MYQAYGSELHRHTRRKCRFLSHHQARAYHPCFIGVAYMFAMLLTITQTTATMVRRYDMLALTDFQQASHRLQRTASRPITFNQSSTAHQFGSALASLGDIDADGFAEFAVTSAPQRGHLVVSIIRVVAASHAHTLSSHTVLKNYTLRICVTSLALIGHRTIRMGKKHQRLTMLAVGVPSYPPSGIVYVLTIDQLGNLVSSPTAIKPPPNVYNSRFGASMTYVGDINGDGSSDLLIGAPGESAMYMALLNDKGQKATLKRTHKSSNRRESFASSMASIGDMNDDGVMEVLISSSKSIHLICLNQTGYIMNNKRLNLPNIATRSLIHSSALSFVGLDDTDNVTFAIGSRYDNDGGREKGAIWVASIDVNGTVIRCVKYSETQGNLDSNLESGDHFGASLATALDVNKDGFAELLVGVPRPPSSISNFFGSQPNNNKPGSLWILDVPGTRSVRVTKLGDMSTSSSCIYTNSSCTCSFRQAPSASCLALAQMTSEGSFCHERFCSRAFECGKFPI